jgi:hypothetical protein
MRALSIEKYGISFIMSVCPPGTIRLPLDEFLLNLVFGGFLKKLSENSTLIAILLVCE